MRLEEGWLAFDEPITNDCDGVGRAMRLACDGVESHAFLDESLDGLDLLRVNVSGLKVLKILSSGELLFNGEECAFINSTHLLLGCALIFHVSVVTRGFSRDKRFLKIVIDPNDGLCIVERINLILPMKNNYVLVLKKWNTRTQSAEILSEFDGKVNLDEAFKTVDLWNEREGYTFRGFGEWFDYFRIAE